MPRNVRAHTVHRTRAPTSRPRAPTSCRRHAASRIRASAVRTSVGTTRRGSPGFRAANPLHARDA